MLLKTYGIENRYTVSTLLLLFILLLGLFTYDQTANAGQRDEDKVGIPNNMPMCYFDDTGNINIPLLIFNPIKYDLLKAQT